MCVTCFFYISFLIFTFSKFIFYTAAGATAPTDKLTDRIIWVDLEMSGLEVEKERIIEIAVSVTDGKLTKIAEV